MVYFGAGGWDGCVLNSSHVKRYHAGQKMMNIPLYAC